MGKYDQLARDLESTLRTLTTLARTAQPTESEHKRLLDELLMRLSVVETWIPPNVRLVPERTRVSNRLRQLVDEYEKRPTSASLASVAEWLDNAVLPYARSLALEESRPATAEHRTLGSPGELTGAKFGNWRLLEQIAAGGHSSVYKAENAMTGLIGCVKAIPLLPHDIAEQEERFRREARVPAEVGHPALVRVYDAELSNEFNAFFIAMELVDGVAITFGPVAVARRRSSLSFNASLRRWASVTSVGWFIEISSRQTS